MTPTNKERQAWKEPVAGPDALCRGVVGGVGCGVGGKSSVGRWRKHESRFNVDTMRFVRSMRVSGVIIYSLRSSHDQRV